jgi:predicted O-methyltransferase YrrM
MTDSLSDPTVAAVLARLHREARGDRRHVLRLAPRLLWGALRGRSLMKTLRPQDMTDVYIPVSPEAGRLVYALARARAAPHVVEFGASFGISTLYLAAAARDTGGVVTTTEIEPTKCRRTEANLGEAGLADHVRVLEGDALVTLRDLDAPVDLLFLDGWKDIYLDVLAIVRPHLRAGALVVADNTNFRDARPFVEHVRTPANGFVSTPLFGGTMELCCLTQ